MTTTLAPWMTATFERQSYTVCPTDAGNASKHIRGFDSLVFLGNFVETADDAAGSQNFPVYGWVDTG